MSQSERKSRDLLSLPVFLKKTHDRGHTGKTYLYTRKLTLVVRPADIIFQLHYAADNYVTWVRPISVTLPTYFAPIEDPSAVPYLNDAGRQGYHKYLAFRKPKAFAIAPDGAWAASSLGDDPLSAAMESCKKVHQGCQLYAVDNQVVWPIDPM